MSSISMLGLPVRFAAERDRPRGWLLRMWWRYAEVAYIVLGLRGVKAEIEFPSDWHERQQGWMRLGLGIITFAFAFPWPWLSKDDGQCSGHTFGFSFFGDGLHLHWGKQRGKRTDPFTIIRMPWAWRHVGHGDTSAEESHQYRYTLRSGEVQERVATIKAERWEWWRPWLPFRRVESSISIDFSDEVGERTGSWKGGVLGCSFTMLEGETPLTALRRMEAERKFT